MKNLLKHLAVAMIACMVALAAPARVINIDASAIKGDLTKGLRTAGEKAAMGDTVVLTFGKGTYTIGGTIQFKCNLVMRGKGRGKTTLVLDNGSDKGDFKAFKDDSFINIFGRIDHTISATISDMSIRLKEHKGLWWEGTEKYAVKIYHAHHVDISDVDSYMSNANITNFDLRVCSNVTVTGCNITNYNNSPIGGCLWIRGEMHNIQVRNNKFYKYGKDEALGLYSRLVNANGYVRGSVNRSNIYVTGNDFYYGGYTGKDKIVKPFNQVLVSLFTDQKKSQESCTTRNFHLEGNTFHINDKCTRCLYLSFDPADRHSDIYIQRNKIINSALGSTEKYYRQDIEVNDLSQNPDTIFITDNEVRNDNVVINPSGTPGYSFLLMQGGNVCLDGNKIVNEATIDRSTGKATGVQLIWAGAMGGTVTLRNNVCKGLNNISTVGAGDGTPLFTINATNNYFAGDTRVYCHNIEQLHLNFTSNTFVSEDANFFLQEFASRGTLVFNNNKVTVNVGGGKLMTHWSKAPLQSMRFDRLEVRNNTFKGVKSETELLKNIVNAGKRTVRSNTVRHR